MVLAREILSCHESGPRLKARFQLIGGFEDRAPPHGAHHNAHEPQVTNAHLGNQMPPL
jgi:hypothetical protein